MQVIVDGLLTSYDKLGDGQPVLFLHGWGDNRQGLASLAKSLAGIQAILVDLPGFGQTQAPPTAWGLDDYAVFVAAFLKKIGVQPKAIVGHSNGGAIAIRGLSKGSLKPAKLVLLASAGIRSESKARKKVLKLAAKTAKLLTAPLPAGAKRKLKGRAYGAIGSEILVAEHLQETFKKIVTDDVLDDAARVAVPTLLVYGSADTATPVRYGEKLAARLPQADLKVVPGAGHFAHLDSPEVVSGYVQEFPEVKLLNLLSFWTPVAPHRFIYMLQQVEYNPRKFLAWLFKLPNLLRVMHRKQLVMTRKAQALLVYAYGWWAILIVAAALFARDGKWPILALRLLLVPLTVALILALTVAVGNRLLYLLRRPLLKKARRQLQAHPAVKIAVLGSYGKTTMKELLLTVLSEARNVKATPGNMNVPVSHARWITTKVGKDEDVLVFEYGEGRPGDIARFAKLTRPDRGVITGLAPNHLDHYPNLEAVAKDLLSIRQAVPDDKLLLNVDANLLHQKAPGIPVYGNKGVNGWKISGVTVDYDGTGFAMKKGSQTLRLHTKLLGRHQVGPLAAVVAFAAELGLTPAQIEAGIAKTEPFEHRMQARSLHGAWIIDDTYNGNLEGIRAGLQLMTDLTAKQKIYVTPGLVDQGIETDRVHREVGRLIARANPDKVVLMQNSVTEAIQAGLDSGDYKGEVIVEDDPLNFYVNLEHSIAAGDLLVMQNDWTDNYL